MRVRVVGANNFAMHTWCCCGGGAQHEAIDRQGIQTRAQLGRFANATGIISYVVEQNFLTGAYTVTGVGSIDY